MFADRYDRPRTKLETERPGRNTLKFIRCPLFFHPPFPSITVDENENASMHSRNDLNVHFARHLPRCHDKSFGRVTSKARRKFHIGLKDKCTDSFYASKTTFTAVLSPFQRFCDVFNSGLVVGPVSTHVSSLEINLMASR